MLIRIFIPYLLIFILLLTGCSPDISTSDLPTCTKTDCNCSDFTTQEEAQRVLDAFSNDRYKLDGDGNGIACESLARGKKTTTTPKAIGEADTQSAMHHLIFISNTAILVMLTPKIRVTIY